MCKREKEILSEREIERKGDNVLVRERHRKGDTEFAKEREPLG